MGDNPLAFPIVTVAANPEVTRYPDRHGAIILSRRVMYWLKKTVPEIDLLKTPPARTFVVGEITSGLRPESSLSFRATRSGKVMVVG